MAAHNASRSRNDVSPGESGKSGIIGTLNDFRKFPPSHPHDRRHRICRTPPRSTSGDARSERNWGTSRHDHAPQDWPSGVHRLKADLIDPAQTLQMLVGLPSHRRFTILPGKPPSPVLGNPPSRHTSVISKVSSTCLKLCSALHDFPGSCQSALRTNMGPSIRRKFLVCESNP